jgi:hypothetical protein
MELSPYLDTVREGLTAAVAAGGEPARQLGAQLAAAVEPATRLALMEAISAAAAEITAALDDATVDVHLRGREPQLVVTALAPPAPPPPSPLPPPPPDAEAGTSRITLRLPEHLKTQTEEAAARRGVSVNSWLVSAVTQALNPPTRQHRGPGQRLSGFVQS